MNAEEVIEYLRSVPLVEALWWAIENITTDDPRATRVFFYLRERYCNEMQNTPKPMGQLFCDEKDLFK